MRTVGIVLSRMGSNRLPGKALLPMAGTPMLERLLERVNPARSLDGVVVATTTLPDDDPLAEVAASAGAAVFRGDADDVLGRLSAAARDAQADVVVVFMGDSPLVSADLVDATVRVHSRGGFDYTAGYTETVRLPEHAGHSPFPVGLSVQVVDAAVLDRCDREMEDPYAREHSTSSIYGRPDRFRLGYLEAADEWAEACRPDLFLAVNLRSQYELVARVFERLRSHGPDFDAIEAIRAADAILEEESS